MVSNFGAKVASVDCAAYTISITVSATGRARPAGSINVSVGDTLTKTPSTLKDYATRPPWSTHFPTDQLTYSETIHWSAPNGQSGILRRRST